MTARATAPWLLLAVLGWGYVLWLGNAMLSTDPPSAGFDLVLLLDAARDLAAGRSPYDPAMVSGASVEAQSLFYSYAPPVAVAMRAVAWLPDGLALVVWGALATVATVAVGVVVARRFGSRRSTVALALPIAATLPFVLPFSIAVLFGNLNVWFPALYGLMLLAAAAPASSGPDAPDRRRWTRVTGAGGVALAVAAVAKLHPASLGAWFLVRGWRPDAGADARSSRRVVVVALVTGSAIVGLGFLLAGVGPWADYVAVIRAGAGADLVDPRNGAPAVIIGSIVGATAADIRVVQAVVSLGALVATIMAAWRIADPVLAFAVAAVASLITLPVTWYHYPVALIPFAIAALARAEASDERVRRQAVSLIAGALAVATVAIAWLPLMWLAVGLLLAAVARATPPSSTASARTIG